MGDGPVWYRQVGSACLYDELSTLEISTESLLGSLVRPEMLRPLKGNANFETPESLVDDNSPNEGLYDDGNPPRERRDPRPGGIQAPTSKPPCMLPLH